jgi:hypothetical protein
VRFPELLAALALLASVAASQETPVESERVPWEISGSVFYSDPPGAEDRLTPILYADRGALHLELRHNYEDLQTTSLWAGWNLDWELGASQDVALGLTPMLGLAAGDTDGIAPGLELDVGWRRLEWYAEMEYLFDFHDHDDDFYYSWSTLTYGLTDWLGAGLVIERSKLVDTDFSVQRGLLVEVSRAPVGLSLQAYNLGSDDSYAVVALEFAP